MKNNTILVFTGPTGVGKTTIIDYLKQNYDIRLPICFTTRKKRNGDDESYVFVDEKAFSIYEQKGIFFFTTGEGNNKYGFLDPNVEEDKPLVFATSYENAIRLKNTNENIIVITLVYQDILSELPERLKNRNENLSDYKNRFLYDINDCKNNFQKISNLSSLILCTSLHSIDEMNNIVSNYLYSYNIIKKNSHKELTR